MVEYRNVCIFGELVVIEMNTVKTYQKINSDLDNVSFGISRMEDIYTKRKGKVDEPHRHNYYTVLIVKKAKGEHKIDFNSYKLSNKHIWFLSTHRQTQKNQKSYFFANAQ